VEELKKRNYNIHFHVWDERGFREFVKGAQKYLHNTFDIEYLARNNTELITVFRRIDRAGRSKNKPLGMISQGRSNLQILAEQIEAAQKAHSEERDRLEGELRRSLQERETEINQARKTIDGLVREIDQARSNMHILSDQIDQARQAHLERDRLEMELRQALKVQDGRTRELTTQLEFLSNDLEQLRKSWSHRLFHPLEAYLRGKG
jgi:chromosome segregation ATPase